MADAYAEYSDAREIWGASRLPGVVDGMEATRERVVESALAAASFDIDEAAVAGGYIVPLVPADLTDDADLQTRIAEKLKNACVALATYCYLQPIDVNASAKAARERLDAWLARMAKGEGLGLPVTPTPSSDELSAFVALPEGAVINFNQRRLAEGRAGAP